MPEAKVARMQTRWPLAIAAVVLAMALAPAAAQAQVAGGIGVTSSIEFPSTVTVGDTDVVGSVFLGNNNFGNRTADTNVVCNAGDPLPGCGAGNPGILVFPSCEEVVAGACDDPDPGVFVISETPGTAVGAGACAGVVFDVDLVDPATGATRFTPLPAAAANRVTLVGRGATCRINFRFSVVRSPTTDQNPVTPLTNETAQSTQHTQVSNELNAFARVSSNGATNVLRAQPAITTLASPNINLGGQLTDQATVTGLVSAQPGATVTFRLYPPGATVCEGTPVFVNEQPVALNPAGTTATATSAAYAPTVTGIYRWVATYSGDDNNNLVRGACNEATETRTVSTPGTTTTTTTTPPPPPPVAPPPPPAQGVAAVNEAPVRGTAAITGRTGCQGRPFNVIVSGRQIERVVFSIDGRVVSTLRRPNSGSRYKLAVNPRNLRTGIHRVIARTTFLRPSATRARTLRVTFSRCSRRATAPAFTG